MTRVMAFKRSQVKGKGPTHCRGFTCRSNGYRKKKHAMGMSPPLPKVMMEAKAKFRKFEEAQAQEQGQQKVQQEEAPAPAVTTPKELEAAPTEADTHTAPKPKVAPEPEDHAARLRMTMEQKAKIQEAQMKFRKAEKKVEEVPKPSVAAAEASKPESQSPAKTEEAAKSPTITAEEERGTEGERVRALKPPVLKERPTTPTLQPSENEYSQQSFLGLWTRSGKRKQSPSLSVSETSGAGLDHNENPHQGMGHEGIAIEMSQRKTAKANHRPQSQEEAEVAKANHRPQSQEEDQQGRQSQGSRGDVVLLKKAWYLIQSLIVRSCSKLDQVIHLKFLKQSDRKMKRQRRGGRRSRQSQGNPQKQPDFDPQKIQRDSVKENRRHSQRTQKSQQKSHRKSKQPKLRFLPMSYMCRCIPRLLLRAPRVSLMSKKLSLLSLDLFLLSLLLRDLLFLLLLYLRCNCDFSGIHHIHTVAAVSTKTEKTSSHANLKDERIKYQRREDQTSESVSRRKDQTQTESGSNPSSEDRSSSKNPFKLPSSSTRRRLDSGTN